MPTDDPSCQWVMIDRNWTITRDGGHPTTRPAVGMNVWQAFPGSEPIFRPVYEAAWENGHASGTVLWNDTIIELLVMRRDDELCVSFRYLTLANLEETLSLIQRRRGGGEHPASPQSRQADATRLRLVSSDH